MGHTVIQVPVPGIERITQQLGSTLVCPHITLLGPFVDRGDVDRALVDTIREVLRPIRAFDFRLSTVGCFASGLTYLVPTPSEPFVELTRSFAAAFPQWLPYGGVFDEVIPHLSIGDSLSGAEVKIVHDLLPISMTANEVTLTWWSKDFAEVLERFPLRALRESPVS